MKKLTLSLAGAMMISSLMILAGCGNPTTTDTRKEVSTEITFRKISIDKMAFAPDALVVKPNTVVMWTNNDKVAHTITSDSGSFHSGTLASGQNFSYTFNKEGAYAYHCAIHPSMLGTVVVKP